MEKYLEKTGLNLDEAAIRGAGLVLRSRFAEPAAGKWTVEQLYRYPVPKLGEGGSCSLVDELEPVPFDIAPLLGGENVAMTRQLLQLQAWLDATLALVPADWLGFYLRVTVNRQPALLKLAYRGLPSRAVFPLTEEFAVLSNNSKVGRNAQAVVINDVAAWVQSGQPYYECDPKVKSEVCLPVLGERGEVLGILDAESAQAGFFSQDKQAVLVALARILAVPMREMNEVLSGL